MRDAISIDIGSTYTKGALLSLDGDASRVLARAAAPTTARELGRGVASVLRRLLGEPDDAAPERLFGRAPIYWSSSARGGLRIAAIGLTRALTVSAARQAACSAGGRVVRAYASALTAGDARELETLAPDIVLLAGGTGGSWSGGNVCAYSSITTRLSPVFEAGGARGARAMREVLRGP